MKGANQRMTSKFPKTSTPREQLAQPTTPLSPQPNLTLLTRYEGPRVTSGLRHRKVNRANKSDSGSKPDDSSLFVPPESIAQHWGEEWVPTFTRDVQDQEQHDTSEPCSDAYLSGMPPKKRRCVRQSRPPTTLNSFIDESMNEVSSMETVEGEELRSAFREHMRRIARERAAISDDYEPRRFVATARFLKQNRTSMRKSPESSSSE